MLQWHFAGKLSKSLKNLDENHLAKILLGGSRRAMRADQFGDERIKPANQLTSRFIVVPQRSFHQCACIRIIHVVEVASTLLAMTGVLARRLQLCRWRDVLC